MHHVLNGTGPLEPGGREGRSSLQILGMKEAKPSSKGPGSITAASSTPIFLDLPTALGVDKAKGGVRKLN